MHSNVGTVSGSVSDKDTLAPLANVEVSIPGYPVVHTNASGQYSTQVAPDTYSVTFTLTNYVTQTIPNVLVEFERETTVNCQMAKADGHIIGTIRDKDSNIAISGAIVGAGGKNATTGADGKYDIQLYPNSYDVSVTVQKYVDQTKTGIVVQSNQSTPCDFAMAKKIGTIKGGVSGT